jgi:hypothetical protein
MGDIFSVLWTILSFILGLAWSLIWFVLRDLLSTLTWLGIFVWLGFVLRYRSFQLGSLAMLRYARYGVVYLWRWVRGRSADGLATPITVTKIVKEREYHERIPYGYANLSEQLNALLLALLIFISYIQA